MLSPCLFVLGFKLYFIMLVPSRGRLSFSSSIFTLPKYANVALCRFVWTGCDPVCSASRLQRGWDACIERKAEMTIARWAVRFFGAWGDTEFGVFVLWPLPLSALFSFPSALLLGQERCPAPLHMFPRSTLRTTLLQEDEPSSGASIQKTTCH